MADALTLRAFAVASARSCAVRPSCTYTRHTFRPKHPELAGSLEADHKAAAAAAKAAAPPRKPCKAKEGAAVEGDGEGSAQAEAPAHVPLRGTGLGV